eukprot:g2488.t1
MLVGGISLRSFPLDGFGSGSFVDYLALVSYMKREGEVYQYSVKAPARNYLLFHQPLLDWIVEQINEQKDTDKWEEVWPQLHSADYPTSSWIALGAGDARRLSCRAADGEGAWHSSQGDADLCKHKWFVHRICWFIEVFTDCGSKAEEYTDYGSTHFLKPLDEIVVVVYDERLMPDGPDMKAVLNMFEDAPAPEGAVMLHQTFV